MKKNIKPVTQPQEGKDADPADAAAERPSPTERSPENDPAVERGERIATGKAIARSGQGNGAVPGATPQGSSNQ